ncbi:aldose epimerase family protein [Macrococcus capreoli]|uniref:aldose epimerase family protein n=1 Tax=Macrococcus capreoli TaxID=2982690 RepID=UPI0021D5745A|nr:aldose epimerase family protein [Macrococcus sp. TMW 2.2395]MCU7556126.1 galactose mutarotase [Macrococcus sp. TMW 2.2395]
MNITEKKFDELHGNKITEYIIETDNMIFSFIDFGARVHKILTNKLDVESNIILSVNTAKDYINSGGYFGATVGRVAGRIDKGKFVLNDQSYQLECNDGNNHLHGGTNAIDKKIWSTEIIHRENAITLKFNINIYEADDHYPGDIQFEVHHTITNDNTWTIEYFAISSKDTLFNPTNHVYFNLNQDYTKKIDNHYLTLNHNEFAEINEQLIPTGKIKTSDNFNFKNKNSLSNGINNQDQDNKLVNGYDHPFILEKKKEKTFTLENELNNIKVEVVTDRECVVVYTSNMLDYTTQDKIQFVQYGGVTLETQMLPDAINHCNFGNIILKKDEKFYSKTIYKIIN